ncbi:hypothetical protein TrVFT333_008027 [Trichoderma virens FT-333]|nr:hypothetical protein TrVFT333_008027 [Trichoderma virens FT-333]
MTASSDEGEIVEQRAGDLKATSLSHAERNGVDHTATRLDEAARPHEDTSGRAMIGISSLLPEPEIKILAMIAAPTTTIGGMSTKDRASHMTISTAQRHALRTKATTGAVVGTESAIGVANGIDTTAAETDILNVHRLALEALPLANTVGETSELAIDLSGKATLTGAIQGNCAATATSRDVPMDDYEEPEEFDEEAEIERRRKRREELMAKSSSATPLLLHAVGAATSKAQALSPASFQSDTPQVSQRSDSKMSQSPRSNFASPGSPLSHDAPSPGAMDVFDGKDLINSHGAVKANDEDGPSAADYDPTVDMMEDGRRDELRHGQVVIHGEPEPAAAIEQNPAKEAPSASPQKPPAGDGDEDDDFDMFAEDFDEEKYASKAQVTETAAPDEATEAVEAVDKGGILEGDDKDGYYKIRIGEVLNGRYQVQATLGRGMFSGVARAVDITTKQLVAIKMMRNNDALRKGGYTEIAILQKLNDADPENKRHIVKFERSFDHRGHLCMAFENLSMNLREVLRKFGNNVGINLKATKAYAYQSFVALAHMRKCSIIHADLKPDNILVNETRSILKICDLGTAIDRSDAATAHTEITPYLVSRFYRAPEIILGMPYDYGVDMWSIGCTLYELYTGKILFAGDSNNQMLKAIMEIRGRITPKLYKRGQLSGVHFDDQGQFVSVERDKVLGKTALRTLNIVKPTRDLRTRLLAASGGMNDAESRELNHFIDLLDHCLALNPDKRIKPADALKHPFFTTRSGAPRR